MASSLVGGFGSKSISVPGTFEICRNGEIKRGERAEGSAARAARRQTHEIDLGGALPARATGDEPVAESEEEEHGQVDVTGAKRGR